MAPISFRMKQYSYSMHNKVWSNTKISHPTANEKCAILKAPRREDTGEEVR